MQTFPRPIKKEGGTEVFLVTFAETAMEASEPSTLCFHTFLVVSYHSHLLCRLTMWKLEAYFDSLISLTVTVEPVDLSAWLQFSTMRPFYLIFQVIINVQLLPFA